MIGYGTHEELMESCEIYQEISRSRAPGQSTNLERSTERITNLEWNMESERITNLERNTEPERSTDLDEIRTWRGGGKRRL